jgi:hypothetical protein
MKEKTIDSSSSPIIDRVRLPCFHATFFFSPLQTHRSHKKECTWKPPHHRFYIRGPNGGHFGFGAAPHGWSSDWRFSTQLVSKNHPHNTRLSSDARLWGNANFLLPFPRSSKVTSKHDMSLQVTCPIFAWTLVCSFDRIFRGEFRTSNLS